MFSAFVVLLALTQSVLAAEYNYFDFVRQWSPNTCYKSSHRCISLPEEINYWTIHGLWPSYDAKHYPSDCWDYCRFNSSKVTDLLPNMHMKWPTDYNGGDTRFWDHEYCKHSTCCTDVLPKEHDYFQKALELNQQFDMDKALANSGITPSTETSYSIDDVDKAFRVAFNVERVTYWCRFVRDNRRGDSMQLISQVSLCIGKDFQTHDCPEENHRSCDYDQPVYFLPFSVL